MQMLRLKMSLLILKFGLTIVIRMGLGRGRRYTVSRTVVARIIPVIVHGDGI